MIFTPTYRDKSMIGWIITSKCNFKCAYCFHDQNNNSLEPPIELEIIEEAFTKLGQDWIIYISGGEPFLKKDFIRICKSITKHHYIAINSNLSTDNIYKFADELSPKKVLFISCGMHIEEREKRDPDLKRFIKRILYLQNKNFNVRVAYVAHPTLILRIRNDFNWLGDRGVKHVRMKSFRGRYNNKYYPMAYNEQERSILNELETDFPENEILNNNFYYKGLQCAAGSKEFMMDEIGNLKRCSALNRNYGNLFKGNFTIDHTYRPCPRKTCGCPYEGIRNITDRYSNKIAVLEEQFCENYFQFKRILQNPHIVYKKIRSFI